MTTYFSYPSIEVQKELKCIAETLVTCGKGILAADESVCTMGKRLQEIGVPNEEDIRRQWRQTLFSTDRQVADYISGVILFHETLCQKDEHGKTLTDYLKERCIIPGVKVDTGLVTLYNSEDEVTTQGLDNLGARLAQYKAEGVEFARWRTVFKIGKNTPSNHAISTNCVMIARFASICQSQRICPIIEPEVIPDGEHDIERCQKVTETVLSFVYKALNDHHIYLEGTLLKPNMVTSGLSNMHREDAHVIARATLTALRRTVPPAVPGIVFSSGGQTEEEATCNLNAINNADGCKPWRLTFAYGRALQASALRTWAGRHENEKGAQDEFIKRAKANGEASQGLYHGSASQHSASQHSASQHSTTRNATTRFGDTRRMYPPPRSGPSMHPGEEECCGTKGTGGTQRRPSATYSKQPFSHSPRHSPGSGMAGAKSPRYGPGTSGGHGTGGSHGMGGTHATSGSHATSGGHSTTGSHGISGSHAGTTAGYKYTAARSNPRFAHPIAGLEPSRFQETNMGPDGQTRYDPKECARYSANNTNLDQDLSSMITKTTDTTSDTTNRTTK